MAMWYALNRLNVTYYGYYYKYLNLHTSVFVLSMNNWGQEHDERYIDHRIFHDKPDQTSLC